jgi:phage protein D
MATWWRIGYWIAAVLAAGGPAHGAELRASKAETKRAIAATIEGQLAAFRAGDVPAAHAFAAAELRAQKPAAVFAEIVRTNYPEIWANTAAEIGVVFDDGARATVTVQVAGAGTRAAYDYTLKKEAAGWRIFGVLRRAVKAKDRA